MLLAYEGLHGTATLEGKKGSSVAAWLGIPEFAVGRHTVNLHLGDNSLKVALDATVSGGRLRLDGAAALRKGAAPDRFDVVDSFEGDVTFAGKDLHVLLAALGWGVEADGDYPGGGTPLGYAV